MLRSVGESMLGFGYLTGSILFGQVSDRFGRHLALKLALFSKAIVMLTLPYLQNVYVVIFFFYLNCTFGYGTVLTSFVLVCELTGSSKRLMALCLLEFGGQFGEVVAIGLFYFTRDWRKCVQLHAFIFIFMISSILLIVESPLWLISNKYFKEASFLIKSIASGNKKVLTEEKISSIINQLSSSSGSHIASEKDAYSAIDVFRYRNLRKKALLIFFNWFTVTASFYAVYFNMSSLHSDLYTSYLLGVFINILGFAFAYIGIYCVGRRIMFSICMSSGGLTGLCLLYLSTGDRLIFILCLIGRFFFSAAFTLVYVWSGELYPTPVRNVALGLSSICGRVGLLLVPYALQYGLFAQACISLLGFASASLSLLLPETTNCSLPQTIADSERFSFRKCSEIFSFYSEPISGSLSKSGDELNELLLSDVQIDDLSSEEVEI